MSHRPVLARRNLLRLGAGALIPEMLEEQGISAQVPFWRAGFNRRSPDRPDPVVPLVWLGRVFNSAAAATAQTEFGLLVGLRAGSRLMDWGQGKTPGDTQVGAALIQIISRPTSFPNSFLTLSVSGNTCTISCTMLPRNVIARDQLADCALGFAAGALRVLCGPRWRPSGFYFERATPPDPLRLMALLQAPISFGASVTAVEFDSAWLDRDYAPPKNLASDDVNECRPHQDPVDEVRAILASWNATDRPSAPAVASALRLNPRTLNRLLGKKGTSFNQMLEDTRYQRARQLLRDPAAPILSIAWSLGYADASAFSRAFRRWSGMTPTEWRQAAESGVR